MLSIPVSSPTEPKKSKDKFPKPPGTVALGEGGGGGVWGGNRYRNKNFRIIMEITIKNAAVA
jgi:hypothetical protein